MKVRKLRVGPQTYTIKHHPKRDPLNENQPLYGDTNREKQRIRIRTDIPQGAIKDTLLHEALHAVLWESGAWQMFDSNAEETFIRQVAPWLLMLLRDNPKLVRYLTEE